MNKAHAIRCISLPAIILLLVTLITGNLNLQAQQDFEGYIVYKATEPDHSDGEFDTTYPLPARKTQMIRIYFSPGKILIHTNTLQGGPESELLVLLDSGKVYELDGKASTYTSKDLRVTKRINATRETIAGHAASPVGQDLPGIPMMEGPATFWFADSLFYHLPEKFAGNDELLFVYKDRILLKLVMTPWYGSGHDNDDGDLEKLEDYAIMLVANEIVRSKNDPAIFTIPSYYKKIEYPDVIVDTAWAMPDTAVSEPVLEQSIPIPSPARETPEKKPVKKTNSQKAAGKKGDENQ